ncbi:pyridoxal-phosphate dependent enzyme [Roseospira navarrensis]|uniref:threonine ammonia-lyase n=1 Tax=Roseospira navarrensis TaxID=140058 RepID=A0A7X1ZH55_9PROT|nr:pyridoxal-phosphate dependent enzyme [Roseospira navarrensis]MQX38459.1 pyridoxal-phosphate dependent enzyme [Roseospira navarrensis]
MVHASPQLKNTLIAEILKARERVYRVGQPTPLERLPLSDAFETWIKREDLSPINAYKWRGAQNCTARMVEEEGARGVVAASAGNHAQGVALSARRLGIPAVIFMPRSTPQMKQTAVRLHGGADVEVVLVGDSYNEAATAAHAHAEAHGMVFIHPFDDLYTIAGQATIADEMILSGKGPFDLVFVQIGGGGLAAGVGTWIRLHYPNARIIGVEGVDQASMKASLAAGEPVTLPDVDRFCDGTAVTRPGDLTFTLCRDALDEIITVTNDEVCAAIQTMWELSRVIPEPSGAMGLAGLSRMADERPDEVAGRRAAVILCGANMDFGKLTLIAGGAAVGAHTRRYFRFHIGEEPGGLLGLLDQVPDVSIAAFLYGKIHDTQAWPVVAFQGTPAEIEHLDDQFQALGLAAEDVTGHADIRYRVIPYNPTLFRDPVLLRVHFPERAGALRDFLRQASQVANICYFNYRYTGETIGRALMGFEFASAEDRAAFDRIVKDPASVVTVRPVEDDAIRRMLEVI